MNKYELTVVLPGKATAAKKKSVVEKIEKVLKTFSGKVIRLSDWGEIELAYKMKKNDTGVFLHFLIELNKEGVRDVESKLRVEEDIIRYLLVSIK